MKCLHVADLHLDRPFEGLGELPEEFSLKLSQKNFQVFSAIIDEAIKEQVDLLLLVGDIFHQPRIPIYTQHVFIEAMKRLEKEQIQVILTFGNHDYYDANRYWFPFPKNVNVWKSETVETLVLTTRNQETVAISAFSYENRWIEQHQATKFPKRFSHVDYHIGCYHGELGTGETNRYAPFTLGELKEKNYDYWALGHIHQRKVVGEDPLVVYPGAPIGHTKKEQQCYYAALIEFTGQQRQLEWKSFPFVEWKRITYQLTEDNTSKQVILKELFDAVLEQITDLSHTYFVEITLESSPEYSLTEYEQQDILRYLQQESYQSFKQQVWVYQLINETVIEDNQSAFGFLDKQLLHQFLQAYEQQDMENKALDPLYKQPVLYTLLHENAAFKEALLDKSKDFLEVEFQTKGGD